MVDKLVGGDLYRCFIISTISEGSKSRQVDDFLDSGSH